MSDSGGMLDYYLIAQALGWEWNLQTILVLTGISIGLFILLVVGFILISWWLDD